MIFRSLNNRFYLTMENRWVLDENYQFETTDVKTMNVWCLNTRFYLTMESRRLLDEKLHFETTDVKAMKFWSLNTHFYFRIVNYGFLMRNSTIKQRIEKR